MDTVFVITIDGIGFEFHSMNIKRAQLFQVYVDFHGTRRRFHLQEHNGDFLFAMPDDCPPEILRYETELSQRIKQRYNL